MTQFFQTVKHGHGSARNQRNPLFLRAPASIRLIGRLMHDRCEKNLTSFLHDEEGLEHVLLSCFLEHLEHFLKS